MRIKGHMGEREASNTNHNLRSVLICSFCSNFLRKLLMMALKNYLIRKTAVQQFFGVKEQNECQKAKVFDKKNTTETINAI